MSTGIPPWKPCPREQLRALQDERLRDVVRRVYEHVPFYRNKMQQLGITPNDIHGVEDLHLLPFTEKKDLRNNYPFGLFAVPQSEIVRIHASSGTTGKPSVAGYTSGDIDRWAELMARAMYCANVGKNDIVQVAYGYGLFTGRTGRALRRGARRRERDSHERRQYCAPAHADGGLRLNGAVLHAFLCAQPGRCHGARRHHAGPHPLKERHLRRRALDRGHAPPHRGEDGH